MPTPVLNRATLSDPVPKDSVGLTSRQEIMRDPVLAPESGRSYSVPTGQRRGLARREHVRLPPSSRLLCPQPRANDMEQRVFSGSVCIRRQP